jgi:hypothetical protein
MDREQRTIRGGQIWIFTTGLNTCGYRAKLWRAILCRAKVFSACAGSLCRIRLWNRKMRISL